MSNYWHFVCLIGVTFDWYAFHESPPMEASSVALWLGKAQGFNQSACTTIVVEIFVIKKVFISDCFYENNNYKHLQVQNFNHAI